MSCAVFSTTLLLSTPACAATIVGGGGKIIPRATAPTSFAREDQDADCAGPGQKHVVPFNLALQTPLPDAVAWISSIVCKPFLLPGTIAIENKMLTIDAPERGTPEEAYRLFLGALERVGLTVDRTGPLQRIAEPLQNRPPPPPPHPPLKIERERVGARPLHVPSPRFAGRGLG